MARIEVRPRKIDEETWFADVLVIAETPEESRQLDYLGSGVGPDGLIATGEYELRLSDGYGEHYALLKGTERVPGTGQEGD